jgi:hypothetical protein
VIPEEDRGPAWLRDYGGTIEADIQRMEEFAASLEAEVKKNYVPHMRELQDEMVADRPEVASDFTELYSFMQAHRDVQQVASDSIWGVGDGTGRIANAAKIVSQNYANSDAFSYARVTEVERALDQTGVAPPTNGETQSPPKSGSEPTTPTGTTNNSGVS